MLIGFGLLISITCALGIMAVYKMKQVESNARILAMEYIPEVQTINKLKDAANQVMYEMRGYGFTEEFHYFTKAQERINDLEAALDEATLLEANTYSLIKLKEEIKETSEAVDTYKKLVDETVATTNKLSLNRKNLDSSASLYMKNASQFLSNQNEAFRKDLAEHQTGLKTAKRLIKNSSTARMVMTNSKVLNSPVILQNAKKETEDLRNILAAREERFHHVIEYGKYSDIKSAFNEFRAALNHFLNGDKKMLTLSGEKRPTRDVISSSADKFVKMCDSFFIEQQGELSSCILEMDNRNGLINDIIELGNETRIATFKAQALRNPQMIKKALDNFILIEQKINKLLQATTNRDDQRRLENVMDAGQSYRNTMNAVLSNWVLLQELSTKRNEAGKTIISACKSISGTAISKTDLIAQKSAKSLSRLSYIMILGLLLAIVVSAIAAFLVTKSITHPIIKAAQVANTIASGQFDKRLNLNISDEIGQMANALDKMAESISQSFWHKTGVAELANEMRGETDTSVLAKKTVTFLTKYLSAQMASMYLLDEQKESLELCASYAFSKRKRLNSKILIGQGLAGQAALEKNLISVSDVPDDYLPIESTLGHATPSSILAVPLLFQGELVGILEFASFKQFSAIEIEFIEEVVESIAIAVNNAQSRSEIQLLLEKSQAQAEELESQTEELESQQQELRASNEELEQQSEELKASNEELEEKSEALELQKSQLDERRMALEETKRDLQGQKRELELANKYKSEFLANMSHELRTPLNSLLILAKILANNEEGNLTEDQVESAKVIYSGGQDLLLLINEVLDLSKVEAGMLDIYNEEVEVGTVVNNLKKQFLPGMKEKGLEFLINISQQAPGHIVTDGQRLMQILRNFLSNALKFTLKGAITLNIYIPKEDVQFTSPHLTKENVLAFSVSDTGPGIPEDKQTIIFEAFHQADGSTNRNYGGTGLGLSIARSLTQLLNGEIQLNSQEGKGSLFTLYIPLERRENEKTIAASKKDTLKRNRTIIPKKMIAGTNSAVKSLADDRSTIKENDRTVLIVEDDTQFAKIVMAHARKREFKCLAANTGMDGIQLAAQYKPSAIILDLGLPDIDGNVVLENLKKDLSTRHIPIHVMSARDKENSIMQKGVVDYLMKPVAPEDIDLTFNKIESLISRSVGNIMLVEDDERICDAIKKLLKSDTVNITSFGSGSQAHQALKEQYYDCIILDLGLPDMTGFEFLEKLDNDEEIILPPIIVYTGQELTQAELRTLAQYTTNVVVKGANSPERLLDEVALFLHLMEQSLPKKQKDMLRLLHDSDQLLKGRKILLADDDLRNSFAMSKALKKHGLTVVLAENGQMALEILEKDKDIELVLMDIMMPVMDGYEAISKIRNKLHLKNLPIIALTAKAMVEDRSKCIQAGANDYLAKPVDIERVISLLKVLLQT